MDARITPPTATAAARRSQRVAGPAAALVRALESRIGALVAESRRGGIEPGLKAMVITDAETDELLGGPPPAAADWLPDLRPGSLAVALRGWKALTTLQRRFGLAPFEVDVLLACLVVEIECRFERLYAYLADDFARVRPGAELLLRLLAPRSLHLALQPLLLPDAPLRAMGLLQADDAGRGGEIFRVADGIVRHLLGRPGWDGRVQRLLADDDACALTRRLWRLRPEAAALAAALARPTAADSGPLVVALQGRPGSGRLQLARTAAGTRELLVIDSRRLARSGSELDGDLTAALRDAHLAAATPVLHHADILFDDAERCADICAVLQRWQRRHAMPLWFISAAALPLDEAFPAATLLPLSLPELDIGQRAAAWRLALRAIGVARAADPNAAPDAGEAVAADALALQLATKFRTHHGEIARTARQAQRAMQHHGGGEAPAGRGAAWSRILHRCASAVAAPRLHRLADPVRTVHTLADLVLPADKLEVLADLIRRVRHRRQVLEQWGFDAVSARGRGLVALFHGPSGTGKTMAVDAIAGELGMSLFRIDLAGVVSKYIGETEKNLRAVFDEADRADAVLLFDEADALFGKRSEVKDAHDRYANIEINYLLQRIESFDGIAVLATNKPGHLDEAFQRRIHVALEFALPREGERRRLWRRSFPPAAPLAPDIDWGDLARRFELSGGTIRNAALGAAYLAAETGQGIGQRELVRALRTELGKLGRRVGASDFGPYQSLLAAPAATAIAPDAAAATTPH